MNERMDMFSRGINKNDFISALQLEDELKANG